MDIGLCISLDFKAGRGKVPVGRLPLPDSGRIFSAAYGSSRTGTFERKGKGDSHGRRPGGASVGGSFRDRCGIYYKEVESEGISEASEEFGTFPLSTLNKGLMGTSMEFHEFSKRLNKN